MSTALQAELNAPQPVITCEKAGSGELLGLPQCIPMSLAQFGLVSSINTLGGLIGALAAGPVSTKLGRQVALRLTTIFFIMGPIAEAMAYNIFIMAFGRILSGVGAGSAIVVGPIFISEIAPPDSRGLFGAFTQVMTNVGILLTQSLGYFLSKDSLWRVILAVAGVLGAIELGGLFMIPESPAWLADHGKTALACEVLQRIRGPDVDIRPEIEAWNVTAHASDEEQEALLAPSSEVSPPKQPQVTMIGVITDPSYRSAIIAVVGVMIAQQFTGINSIVMYSVSLLQTILPTTASLLAVLISAVNLVITLACSPLPDKIGRKSCLLYSLAGIASSSILLALGIFYDQKALSGLATLLFVAGFGVGLGPVPFILASELVGPEAVGAAQSWALAANWISTFVVAQFFPVLNDALGARGQIYWVFAGVAVLMGAFIYWRVPETKGKTNLDEVWGRNTRID